MAMHRLSAEQIIHKLREAEVELVKGTEMKQVRQQNSIASKTSYLWRREYGGLKVD